jgi:hypothetical protein
LRFPVIPAEAGIQYFQRLLNTLDSGACPGPNPGFTGVTTFYETINFGRFVIFFKKDQTEIPIMASERMKSVVLRFPPIALIVFQLRTSNTAITKSQIESISISFFPELLRGTPPTCYPEALLRD